MSKKKMSFDESRDFVIEKAQSIIEKVEQDPGFVRQAHEMNSALALIVTTERNVVMREALEKSKTMRIDG